MSDELSVELGAPSRVIVVLSTGRNDLTKVMLRLNAPAGVKFNVEEASVENDGRCTAFNLGFLLNQGIAEDVSLNAIDDSIVLFDVPHDTTVHISVPHTDASAFLAMVSSSM